MTAFTKILLKARQLLLYALILAVLIFVLKWLQWKFLIVDNAIELYIGLIALFFTILGIWIATQLTKPKIKKVVLEKEVYVPMPGEHEINEKALEKLQLTKREYEVLQLLTKGLSNRAIADRLYISLSTVKTHVSSLLEKLDVKSRTQATLKAKKLKIVN